MRKERSMNIDENKLEILPEVREDYAAIAEVNNLAFGRENEAKLIAKIRKSTMSTATLCDRYIAELSLVAKLDNKVVGHIMFSYIDLVNKETIKVLALAPVAVLPKYQNKGIGSLLIKTGLEIAESIQTPMIIVLGEPKFYNRFGFKPAINYGIQSPFDVPNEYFMVKHLNSESEKLSGIISYPSAFQNVE